MRDTKVTEQRATSARFHENILGLHIAVHDALRVRERERFRNVLEHSLGALRTEWPVVDHRLLQRASRHQLHHQRESTVAESLDGMHRHDVRVLQAGHRARFAGQPGNRVLSPRRELWTNHLDRHVAKERAVTGAIHHRAAAASQLAQQRVLVFEVANLTLVPLVHHRALASPCQPWPGRCRQRLLKVKSTSPISIRSPSVSTCAWSSETTVPLCTMGLVRERFVSVQFPSAKRMRACERLTVWSRN